MKYIIGYPIPQSEIVRRFRDEDGEFFLEVRGMEEFLFRVTTGDRIYYKIEKSKMEDEELTLVVDYTKIKREPEPLPIIPEWDPPVETDHEMPFSDLLEESSEFTVEKLTGSRSGTVLGRGALDRKEEITELQEGQTVPVSLRAQCKSNDYGGYTLRYKKFLYILDKNYRVDIKSVDSAMCYDLGEEEPPGHAEPTYETLSEPETTLESNKDNEPELEKGDILPPHLRRQCEAEIGPSMGSRVILGDFLYIMDSQYMVTQKMKIAFVGDEAGKEKETANGTAERNGLELEDTVQEPKLTAGEIVDNMVKVFDQGLAQHNISADYFKETVLGKSNRETLVRAYNGDLSLLNDDTREAAQQGKHVIIGEEDAGFNLLKAVMLHELYIKTTLTGRGDNMKYFVSYITAATPSGAVGPTQEDISQQQQKDLVKYFGTRADIYTDKTDIIKRVHRNIRNHIYYQYKELWLSKEQVLFKAYVIVKFYEQTTRLDRGDGITMMRLSSDIMGFQYRSDGDNGTQKNDNIFDNDFGEGFLL
jgi:hypothetical protein